MQGADPLPDPGPGCTSDQWRQTCSVAVWVALPWDDCVCRECSKCPRHLTSLSNVCHKAFSEILYTI